MFFFGKEDQVFHIDQALVGFQGTPNSRFFAFSNCGHHPQIASPRHAAAANPYNTRMASFETDDWSIRIRACLSRYAEPLLRRVAWCASAARTGR